MFCHFTKKENGFIVEITPGCVWHFEELEQLNVLSHLKGCMFSLSFNLSVSVLL